MALQISYPEHVHTASTVIEIACAVHHPLLLLYHIQRIRSRKVKAQRAGKRKQRKSYIAEFSVVVILAMIVEQCWISTAPWNPLQCLWVKKVSGCMWSASRCLLYFLYLERMFFVFEPSAWCFSSRFKWTVRTVVVSTASVGCALIVLFGGGAIDSVSGVCVLSLPSWLLAVAVFIDLVTVIMISVAFCRRLLLLNMTVKSNKATPRQSVPSASDGDGGRPRTMSRQTVCTADSTFVVIQKSLVLTAIALFTTPMSLLLAATVGLSSFWISIDFVVTSWTVVLIFSNHSRIYQRLCERLNRFVTIECLAIYSWYHCEDRICCCTRYRLNEVIGDKKVHPVHPTTATGSVSVPVPSPNGP